jgi:GrpB-like predicted nucleotidyltransferase (UPF0157 family)
VTGGKDGHTGHRREDFAMSTSHLDNNPTSEDQLRACTVGELRPLSSRIRIVDHDPTWPQLYEREADRIRAALGGKVLRIEHVGSTSVPELAAKPIIDILLVVPDSADEGAYVPFLERAGYSLRIREPNWHDHRMLKGPDTDINVHVFSEGCPEVDRHLIFRDRLRSDRSDRELYERVKRDLAQQDWKYVQNYADAKTAVINEILLRASGVKSRPA